MPAWAEANKPRILDFITLLDGELGERQFVAGDRFTVADITGLVAFDFMKPAKVAVPAKLPISSAGMPKSARGRAPRRNSCA